MKVIISNYSGFCPGVKIAEKKLLRQKQDHPRDDLYIYGELIHNRRYIDYLTGLGIITEEDSEMIPSGKTVIIRTHGLDCSAEKKISEGHDIIDLTCSIVKNLQRKIKRYSDEGFYIVISGKKNHPEVLGLKSYAENVSVIENETDLRQLIQSGNELMNTIIENRLQGIAVFSQTTGKRAFFHQICDQISATFKDKFSVECIDSICDITSKREQAALEDMSVADIGIVIGDRKSSNANKLYEVLKQNFDEVYFVNDLEELKQLNLELRSDMTAVVVSSSSTPAFIEDEIVDYLRNI